MTTITVRDESMGGKTINELSLEFPDEQITVHELIRSRVYQEVKDYNARLATDGSAPFQGLVEPSQAETALNGDRTSRAASPVDWQRQFDRAIAAFRANQILILVDSQQVSSLDETIAINPSTEISFLRLTMLIGG